MRENLENEKECEGERERREPGKKKHEQMKIWC